MKIFLIIVKIRDGESEYEQFGLILARNRESARKKAEWHCINPKGHFYFGDHRMPEPKGCNEVTLEQANMLEELCIAAYMTKD